MTTSKASVAETGDYTIGEARVDLAAAHRLAVRDDLHEGTWNHLSLTVPGRPDALLITPPAVHWSRVRASELLELAAADADRVRAEGGLGWIGYRIHAPLHAARPDARCVLHAHCPHATALSMLADGRLEMAEQNALDFHGRIAYTSAYDGAGAHGLEHGEALAAAIGERNTVLFLKNHGVIVVGASVAEAYTDLYLLERACRVMILALSTGRQLAPVPEDAVRSVAGTSADAAFKHAHFAAMKRLLDEEEPDYAD